MWRGEGRIVKGVQCNNFVGGNNGNGIDGGGG